MTNSYFKVIGNVTGDKLELPFMPDEYYFFDGTKIESINEAYIRASKRAAEILETFPIQKRLYHSATYLVSVWNTVQYAGLWSGIKVIGIYTDPKKYID
jgi:hypothetical protein